MINSSTSNLMDKICLSSFLYDHVDDPIDMLNVLFEQMDLHAQLKLLKRWRHVVETNDHFEIDTYSSPIFEHKMLGNLINVAYVLHQRPELVLNPLADLTLKDQEKYLNHECLEGSYLKHLSTMELLDPMLVINDFFDQFSITFYHKQLYEWLSIGMSPNVQTDDSDTAVKIYKNLRRLAEACWLVNKRVGKRSEGTASASTGKGVEREKQDLIPENALSSFGQFLTTVPPNRLNRSLRKMLIDYLFYNIDGLPSDFDEMLNDFYWLTDFLDNLQGKDVDARYL